MKHIVAALLLLVSSVAMAEPSEELFYSFGLGVFNSAKNARAEVKVGNLGYRSHIINGIYMQLKGGLWSDSGGEGRSSGGYVTTGLGMLIDLHPVEIRNGWSLAAISSPDSYLGGHFPQFSCEVYVGVRDKRGNGIGFAFEHISSAGILTPNQGRDLVTLQLSQKW